MSEIIVIARLIILAASVVLANFATEYKGDRYYKKDKTRKWKIVGVIILQLVYIVLGIYNNSPFVVAQVCMILAFWMYWLVCQEERLVWEIIGIVALCVMVITGIHGIATYEENFSTVTEELSKETRVISVTDGFIYPEGETYTFYTRAEDGSIETVTVAKDDVKIYDTLNKNEEAYVEVIEAVEQRWNHNRHTPSVDLEKEKTIYRIYLPEGSLAVV